jgi:glycosyltransferase involved in cell wall biosynthesis
MIRIAFFAPLLTTGGTQRHLQQVLSLLDPDRFTAEVFTLRTGGEVEGDLRAGGVRITGLGLGRRLTTLHAARGLLKTARALRARRVDVVHGYQWRPALFGALAGRLAGAPLVLASKRSLTGDLRRVRLAWRAIGRRVDTIVVNADALRVEAEQDGVQARWALIPSGVEVERFAGGPGAAEAKAALTLDPRRPVIGTVGRLEERKGHEQFLLAARAVLEHANGLAPQLLIVGDGPLRPQLSAQAAALGIADSIRFTGGIADVRLPLAAMDVFVLPSHAEGMSNALLEAMAAGRAVVATAVGGTVEVLDGQRAGVLVPPADPQALARAILLLLADPVRSRRLGEEARRRVSEAFSARAMVARLEHLYEERLAHCSRGAEA